MHPPRLTALAALAFTCAACLSACGTNDSGDTGGGSGSTSQPMSAGEITAAMQLPQKDTIVVTEENDPNRLMGRPNGYTSRVQVSVPGKRCKTVEDDCGVIVEVFDDAAGAERRSKYLQDVMDRAPILGTEYDTTAGTALLRVNQDITPTQAKKYAAAFKAAAG